MVSEISVVIPTYNRSALLERAVESVRAQSFRNFEIIVVDDASTDNTPGLIRSRFAADRENGTLRYLRAAQNQGRSACRNDGIRSARAGLIAFLDDDDEWLPEHLANLYHFLRSHPDTGIAFSNWETVDDRSHETRSGITNAVTGAGDAYLALMLRARIGYPSTALVQTVLLQRIGGFDVHLPLREDWELFSKCALIGGAGFSDKPTVYIFVHAGSYSRNKDQWVNATEAAWNSITSFARDNRVHLGRRLVAERALRLSRAFISIGDFAKAGRYLKTAVRYNPLSALSSIALENVFKLLIGKRLYRWFKK